MKHEATELPLKISTAPLEEWSDKSGSFKTKATFVSATSDTVTLRRQDGRARLTV